MKSKNSSFNWTNIIQPGILLLGILGAVIPLHISIRDDIRSMDIRSESNTKAIYSEMRDFHGRLERQDAEFKSFLRTYLEEKNTNRN